MSIVQGAKKGQDKPHKPVIAKDSVASKSFFRGLYILAEGEVEGLANGAASISLNGTPLIDDAGGKNFEDVTYEFRHGTSDQSYIKGFPSASNEVPVNVELKSPTPYVRRINNTDLSAVTVRIRFGRLAVQKENGDVTGHTVAYAIDLQTDGGVYKTIHDTQISGKTSEGYEKAYRIDLPRATSNWQIRVRRITPNSTSDLVNDKMYVAAITETIDVKLRYPNSCLLALQYDSETFRDIAKISVRLRGRLVKVPSNYNAKTREYTGLWDGTFIKAYTTNPAWVLYDICLHKRFGLGEHLDASMVDKWSLYQLGRYCDEMVSDGKGGQEPRFTCNLYLQKQAEAYKVVSNIAGIFRAMSFWDGERIVFESDIPQDPVYTFNRSNIVGGVIEYTGTRKRDRHTVIKVAWDNPDNNFETEFEYVRDEKAISRYGINVLDTSAFGCTSQAQAQRAGLYMLKTEQLESRQAMFTTGMEGFIPNVGNVITIADDVFAGRANGGRVSKVAGKIITLDRTVVAKVGDVLTVNGSDGVLERRQITGVTGQQITVATAFANAEAQNAWAVEFSDLKTMRFRVMSVSQNDDMQYDITAIQHEPQKFDAIDYGTAIKETPITQVPMDAVKPPASVLVRSRERIVQGQTVTTLVIEWVQVIGAVSYEVEWRKDDGDWLRLPKVGGVSTEVDGIYAGNYQARVAAVSPLDVVSQPTTSSLTTIKGKAGTPPPIKDLVAVGVLFGMELSWSFGAGAGDGAFTEIQVASTPDVNVIPLGNFGYPTNKHTIQGLQGGLTQSYRARLVDKIGNTSPWSEWVTGTTTESVSEIMDIITGHINESTLTEELQQKIGDLETDKGLLDDFMVDTEAAIAGANAAIAAVKVSTDAADLAITAAEGQITATNAALGLVKAKTDSLETDYLGNKTSVNASLVTLTAADVAMNQVITTLDTDYKGNKTSVSGKLTALSNADAAIIKDVNSLKTKTDATNAEVTRVTTIISSNTEAIAQTETTLTGNFTTAIGTAQAAAALDAKKKADKALADAKLDATAKADAAQLAAKDYTDGLVTPLASLVSSKADITALNTVKNDATNALATMKTTITGEYTTAIGTATDVAAADAKKKADAALVAANTESKAKADAAQAAAIVFATAEAKAKADAAQAAASGDATTKANAAKSAAELAAAADAKKKADKALADAKTDAKAKADAAQLAAKKYTDGLVTPLTTVVNSKADITALNTVKNDAANALATMKTTITGEYTTAVGTAIDVAAADAKKKADAATAVANAAQLAANQAATDATNKSAAAQTAAIAAAKIHADAEAKAKADKALADAKLDATTKANAAKSAAELAAALDAKKKADKALADAKLDAKAKADAAQLAAKKYTDGLVTPLTTVVNSKADITALNTVKNDAANALAQSKVDLTADYKQAIDGIEIGGRNFLLNSADVVFNNSDSGNAGLTVSHAQGYKSITPKVTGNVYGYLATATQMDVGTYTMSMEVNTTYATSMYFRIGGVGEGAIKIPNTGGKWQKVTHTYTGTLRAPNANFLLGFVSLQAGKIIYFRGLKVEKGNKATDWTPAPEDVEKVIADNKADIEQKLTVVSNAQSSTAQSVTGLTAKTATAQTTADQAKTAAATAQSKANTADTKATTATSNIATMKTELTATTGKANAATSAISTLSTTVNGHTTSIQTAQSSIKGLEGKYSVRVDAGGRVSGFGLSSNTTRSDFAVVADYFYISSPTGSAKGVKPFSVVGNTTYIKNVVIDYGLISNVKIKTAQIENAAVDTLQIKGNAVSIPVYYNNPNQVLIPKEKFNTWVTVGTAVLPSNESSTSLSLGIGKIKGEQNNYDNPGKTKSLKVGIFKNGVSLREWSLISYNPTTGWTAWSHEPLYFPSILDTVKSTGKVTYEVRVKGENFVYNSGSYGTGNIQVVDVTLIAMGMKR